MKIQLAVSEYKSQIEKYDKHISSERLKECIKGNFVYVLKDGNSIVGILRYSLFWQTIPFLDLIYIDEAYQGRGYGRQMMEYWERTLKGMDYKYAMTSTQEDETAWKFYEKIGYNQIGSFFPPEQEAKELIYGKALPL